jgi:hypothetical protein
VVSSQFVYQHRTKKFKEKTLTKSINSVCTTLIHKPVGKVLYFFAQFSRKINDTLIYITLISLHNGLRTNKIG